MEWLCINTKSRKMHSLQNFIQSKKARNKIWNQTDAQL
jgi:hypothetical protein